jgi:hypothetical protein
VFTKEIQNAKIPVILSMNVKGGVGTAFDLTLTGQEVNELETLIEKLLDKYSKNKEQ